MDLILTSITTGIIDGFSPLRIGMMGLIGFLFFLLRKKASQELFNLGFLFCGAYFFSSILLRIGARYPFPFDDILKNINGILYPVLAIFFCILGLSLSLQWYRMYRFSLMNEDTFSGISLSPGFPIFVLRPLSVFLGILFGFSHYVWPMSVSMALLSNEIFLPSLLWRTVGLILCHDFVALFHLVGFLWCAGLFVRSKVNQSFWRPSGIVSITAAFYLSIGIGLLGLYFQHII